MLVYFGLGCHIHQFSDVSDQTETFYSSAGPGFVSTTRVTGLHLKADILEMGLHF